MSYPFVKAAAQYGRRKGPVKAFIVHMAEGGGTVGFLSRPNQRGVSVHYVIEYTGRIVQMVPESDATGSINPNDLRTTNDPDGFYGVKAAKAIMGDWWRDPNSAAITCEIEGFAKTGPNAAQHGSLKKLIADVRSRFPGIGLLGHRDFQDYKPCPGKLVHWDDLGGHGPASTEEPDVPGLQFRYTDINARGVATVKGVGHSLIRVVDRARVTVPDGQKREVGGKVALLKPLDNDAGDRTNGYLIGAIPGDPNVEAAFLLASDVTFAALPSADRAKVLDEGIAALEALK